MRAMVSNFGHKKDIIFMRQAMMQARLALKHEEVPVGAIVVSPEGIIIGRGYNQTEKRSCQAFHAEMIAITKAGRTMNDWRLCGCWVYVTLEPCCMCMNLITLSRCAGVVYGARSPLFGYQLVDKDRGFWVYNEDVVKIVEGVCAEEASALLKGFFKVRRLKKKEEL